MRVSVSGAHGAASCCSRLTVADLSNDAFPYMTAAGARRRLGAVPRRARHLRRRARLGALLPDRVRVAPLGRAVDGRGASTGSSRAATRRSTRSAWRRGIGCGARTSHPRTRPTRRVSGSRCSWTRGTSSAATALAAARRARTEASLPDALRPACRRARLRAGAGRRRARRVASRAAATGTRSAASIAYAYLPAEHDVGTAVAVEIFGEWVDGEVTAEPLYDPAGERIRA